AERLVEVTEHVGGRAEHRAERGLAVGRLDEPLDPYAALGPARPDLDVDHAPVSYHDGGGTIGDLIPHARRAVRDAAARSGRERHVALGLELGDAAVAPDLLVG